ncbi:MAG: tripartite tricarboxylate transporter substrate binding protein [Xanthobacteraceae bacterium]|nr:tripartite tricarboxylate transporter substrate binding protein [Xanthobacteraceae bacterium]
MRIVYATLAAVIAASVAAQAQTQPYPNRPIKIVVPLTAGSPVDVVGRLVGNHLSAALRQPVIVENRPGAGATIGAKSVAAADPDGYTLLHTAANHVIAPSAFKNLTYDPLKDFAPIGATATMPFLLVVTPNLPIRTVPELIAYSKANPGKLNWGYGLGTSPHLIGELFKRMAKADIASIPYKGGANAVTDILAGQIHMNIGTTATLTPLVKAGKLRAIAVIGEGRYAELPDIPTIEESGIPLTFTFWSGLLAPAATPPDVVQKLSTTLNEVLAYPELKASMAKLGLLPKPGTPQQFGTFLAAERKAWAEAVDVTGVKID